MWDLEHLGNLWSFSAQKNVFLHFWDTWRERQKWGKGVTIHT